MIGIAIYSDSLRAVRLNKKRHAITFEQGVEIPLPDDVIVNGELVLKDELLAALKELRETLEITDDDDVFVGLPNGIFKIGNLCVRSNVDSNEYIREQIDKMGVGNEFISHFAFVSGNFRTNRENFERYNLTPEQIEERVRQQMENDFPNDNSAAPFVMVKTVSYASAQKNKIDEYLNVLLASGLKVVTVEPNAVAHIRYLREEATQPFLFVDVEYDYVNLVTYSERDGMSMMNVYELGLKYFEVVRQTLDGEEQTVLAQTAIDKFTGRLNLAIDMFKENSLGKSSEIAQIIFLNNDMEYLIDAAEDATSIDVLTAETVVPSILSNERDVLDTPNYYLYYLPIILTQNEDTEASANDYSNRNIEANFLSQKAKEEAMFKQFRRIVLKGSHILVVVTGLIFLAVIGMNIINLFRAGYGQATPPEVIAKYNQAKEQGDILKDNIEKFNTIASKRSIYSKTIDSIVAVKPANVYLTGINIGGKSQRTRRIVVECMSTDTNAPQKFVEDIAKIAGLSKARILSQQMKDNKTAAQIVIPIVSLSDRSEARASREEKRKK